MKCQEAVQIAQDCLSKLEQNRLNVKREKYVYFNTWWGIPDKGSLQQYIDCAEEQCQVCGLGSLFLSYIRLFNNVAIEDILYESNPYNNNRNRSISRIGNILSEDLQKYFSVTELRNIEIAFEGKTYFNMNGYFSGCEDTDDYILSQYKDLAPKQILEHICKNIIDNDGEFKP